MPWVQLEHPGDIDLCAVDLGVVSMDETQVVVGIDVVGFSTDGLTERRDGPRMISQVVERDPHVEQGLGTGGVQ